MRAPLGLLTSGALVGAVFWLGLGSCSSEQDTLPTTPDAGAAGSGGSGTTSTSSASDAGGSGGTPSGCQPPDASSWSLETDSCWRPVDWPAPCTIEVAEQPHLAVPPLRWEPCPWEPTGCSWWVMDWPGASRTYAGMPPTVVPHDGGYRVAFDLTVRYGEGESLHRTVVYETDGTPLAVWRDNSSEVCMVFPPLAVPEGVWLGASLISQQGGTTNVWLRAPWDELSTVSEPVACTAPSQGSSAANDTLAL